MVQVPTWLKSAAKQALPPGMQASLRAHYLKSSVLASAKDEPEMKIIRSLVRPGDVVLDIGANIGRYTKLLSELVSRQGHVFAFEPIADNFKILSSVVKDGVLANVTPMQVALDREAGHQEMVIPDNSDFTGFYQAHFASQHDRGKREKVNVVSIDGLRQNELFTRVRFIKCDAEGSELGILEGAVTTLQKDRPALFLEVQRKTSQEVFRLLIGLRYRAFVFENRLVEVGEYRSEFWNYFFLGPDSLSQLDPRQLAV